MGLAGAVEESPPRAQAALFAAFGTVFHPALDALAMALYAQDLSDAQIALGIAKRFAVGAETSGKHHMLCQRLVDLAPNGHDVDAPLSTYVQDALICTRAALSAAAEDVQFSPIAIQYALEPMLSWMYQRDLDLIPDDADDEWHETVIADPLMESAIGFLGDSIVALRGNESIGEETMDFLIEGARILLPEDFPVRN